MIKSSSAGRFDSMQKRKMIHSRNGVFMKKCLGFRMKKGITVILVFCLILTFTACGKDENKGESGLSAVNPGITNNDGSSSDVQNGSEDGNRVGSDGGYFSEEYGEYFVGGVTYKLDAATKTATATGVYEMEGTEIAMPDVIDYEGTAYKVTGAAESLLAYQEKLTVVKLPAGLTEIPASMFYGCESLSKIVIPDSVTVIGDNAFTQCFSLTEVTLSANLEKIGAEAFFGCEMLKKVVLPDSVKELGAAAFYDCSLLTSVTLSKNLKAVPDEAFGNCVCLKEVVIPEGIKEIGFEVFWGCSALKSIVIPNSVAVIGGRCFYDCTALQSVTLSASLAEIDREMFAFCDSLKIINVPSSLEEDVNEIFALEEIEIIAR